mmetsp:Transcript_48423/g.125618  ORF Transcript_48423/g.125618 Transcript_48423/m.125618 type:complete len:257 (+) Transcript_48423:621-1391(+)
MQFSHFLADFHHPPQPRRPLFYLFALYYRYDEKGDESVEPPDGLQCVLGYLFLLLVRPPLVEELFRLNLSVEHVVNQCDCLCKSRRRQRQAHIPRWARAQLEAATSPKDPFGLPLLTSRAGASTAIHHCLHVREERAETTICVPFSSHPLVHTCLIQPVCTLPGLGCVRATCKHRYTRLAFKCFFHLLHEAHLPFLFHPFHDGHQRGVRWRVPVKVVGKVFRPRFQASANSHHAHFVLLFVQVEEPLFQLFQHIDS